MDFSGLGSHEGAVKMSAPQRQFLAHFIHC